MSWMGRMGPMRRICRCRGGGRSRWLCSRSVYSCSAVSRAGWWRRSKTPWPQRHSDMHLDKLPRFPLAQLPTPIEELKTLSRELGGPDLLIKRDDQTGLALGGNKTRKLEFLVGQALEQGADTPA